jgi:hypothetical protein
MVIKKNAPLAQDGGNHFHRCARVMLKNLIQDFERSLFSTHGVIGVMFHHVLSMASPTDAENAARSLASAGHSTPRDIGLPGGRPDRQQLRWHRPCNAVALGKFAAQAHQSSAVRHCLYALGYHLTIEGSGKPNHAAQNSQVIRVVQHVTHKALVNLEQGNVQ